MDRILYTYLDSPIGRLVLAGNGDRLQHILLPMGKGFSGPQPAWQPSEREFREAVRQLKAYFDGMLKHFDLPIDPQGTPFQQAVWEGLLKIPYGSTVSYSDLARAIGRPNAMRAVGAANGRNPLPIVIPCHRVIGRGGALVGYGGGLAVKQMLLDIERRHVARS